MAHSRRIGVERVVALGVGEKRPTRGPGHLDHRRGPPVAGCGQQAPLGVDCVAQRAGHGRELRRPADGIEQSLAAVGHGDLVGRPAGRSSRSRHGRRHLGRGRRAPELVGCGDQVWHDGRSYPVAKVR